jgi:hypothetical protein
MEIDYNFFSDRTYLMIELNSVLADSLVFQYISVKQSGSPVPISSQGGPTLIACHVPEIYVRLK